MHRVQHRPMTPEERKRALSEVRRRESAPSPLTYPLVFGCGFLWVALAAAMAFGCGAGLGLLIALVRRDLGHAGQYVLWAGGIAAAVVAAACLISPLTDARKAFQRRRALAAGSVDLGDATVIEGEFDRAAWVDYGSEATGPICVFQFGDDRLGILHGPYLAGLRAEHGFPHRRFRMIHTREHILLGYQGEGGEPEMLVIGPQELSEEDREALAEPEDRTVIPGRLETCVEELIRCRRPEEW
jgi:hypothetical protein